MSTFRITGTEIAIDTANTVNSTKRARVVNTTTGNVVLTVSSNSTVNVGSVTVLANTVVVVEKADTHRLQGTGLRAAPVATRD